MKVCSLLLALLLLLPSAARGGEADDEQPSDLPSTTWPSQGRVACPSLRACCVEGEEECTHPAAARALLAGVSAAHFGAGLVMFAAGDGANKGDPLGGLVGIGIIGAAGSLLGLVAGLLAPRGETTVPDRPSRPTLRLSLTPGGSSTIGERSPYGLAIRLDPTFVLGPEVRLQPHVGLSIELGHREWVDPRPQLASSGGSGLPVALTSHRARISLGLEFALALPYPHKMPRPLYTGPVELRWKPWFELRRRVLQPGTDARQLVGHTALYASFGMRWHVSPRQRFTVYVGPRFDRLTYSDPGSLKPKLGPGAFGSLYAEARWQLDIPFTPLARRATSVTGRLNIGYVHSNLDGRGIDLGPIVGFFGPVEVSFDLRIRKVGAPVALQVTAGYRIAAGGGPMLELGLVTPSIGGARRTTTGAQ
jgi:hypothetical protein